FIFGIPLLMLEFALGQKMQRGAVGAFHKVSPGFMGVGVAATLCSFFVACYYAAVMAWSLIYLFSSFDLSWAQNSADYFYKDVLRVSESPNELMMIPTPILVSFSAIWVMVYFSIWKGVKSVSTVVTVTMPLPIILLLILLVRTTTLPGAIEGILFFLRPDFGALTDSEVWLAAATQIFFSLTVGVGVMITYGSFERKTSDVVKNTAIVAAADAAIALVSGLVVFTTLGHMAHESGSSVVDIAASGPSLAFIVFPKALSLIPGAPFFAFFFFLMLLTLGIDSLFSLVEGITQTLLDRWPSVGKENMSLYVCVFCFFGGLIFTTTAGIYFLDISDHYVTSYGLVLVSLLEALAVGWYHGGERMRAWINSVSDWRVGVWWTYCIKWICPGFLVALLLTGFMRDFAVPYENYPDWALIFMGWSVVAFIVIVGIIFSAAAIRNSDKSNENV
ncbi:MAG: sodium-dependent transporter, partial [Chlamydiia bacterium]|nr:sodium-dependent transporter [Chlamydiia bacterium]